MVLWHHPPSRFNLRHHAPLCLNLAEGQIASEYEEIWLKIVKMSDLRVYDKV